MCEIIYFYTLTCLACVYVFIKIFFTMQMHLFSCKIIYLCITNLFARSNYLFTQWIKLFRDVDPFVRDIHFSLFILYIKCSRCVIFCSLYIIICSLYLFIFYKNEYLFVLLKYLFPEVQTKYLVLKSIFRKYCANIGKCGLVLKILS